jgi:hypothetical protein
MGAEKRGDGWICQQPRMEFMGGRTTRTRVPLISSGSLRAHDLMVSKCFLWSLQLKRLLTPGFTPSPADPKAPPKGERSMPPLEYYQALVGEKLRNATIEQLATRVSRALGMTIPATKPSVALCVPPFCHDLDITVTSSQRADSGRFAF